MACNVCEDSCMATCELSTQCDACETTTQCGSCETTTQCGSCESCLGCEGHPCESACQTYCEEFCLATGEECGSCEDAACQDPCMSACQDNCETSCMLNCQEVCQTGCEVNCQTVCESTCEGSCEYSCQSCYQTCQDSCQTACENFCMGEGQGCEVECQEVGETCIGCMAVGEECLGTVQACEIEGLAEDFLWTTSVYSGASFYGSSGLTQYPLTAAEWNELTTKVNNKRAALGISRYPFSVVSPGMDFTASIINEAIDAINDLGFTMSFVSVGATIYANTFLNLRDNFNSVVVEE